MRTIKFRIIEVPKGFQVQTKSFLGWRYKRSVYDITMYEYPTTYDTEQGCVNRVLGDTQFKKENLRVVRYPNLKEI